MKNIELLSRLKEIALLNEQICLLDLKKLTDARRGIDRKIDELSNRPLPDLRSASIAVSNAVDNWMVWRSTEVKKLKRELAGKKAAESKQWFVVQKAVGRRQVIEALAEKAIQEKKVMRQRRLYQTATG